MRQTSLLAVLTLLSLAPTLPAQTPELVFPVGPRLTPDWRLFTSVQLEIPTFVILLPVTLVDTGTVHLRSQVSAADSLMKSLASVAAQRGYTFEVRAAAWAAIHDRRFNAHYAAAQTEPGPALVIAAPGFRPRLLRYWPTPAELELELEDYATLWRPLIPM
jgi:hypothetical protein